MRGLKKAGAALGAMLLIMSGGTQTHAQTVPGQVPPMPTDMGDLSSCQGGNASTFTGFQPGRDGRYEVGGGGVGTMVFFARTCNDKIKAALDFAVQNRYSNCVLEVAFFGEASYIRDVRNCAAPGAAPASPDGTFNSGNGAQQIAQRFAPALYFLPGESFLASSIEYFSRFTQLECNDQVVRADLSQIQASDLPADGGANCFLVPKSPMSGPYDIQDWLRAGGDGASSVDRVATAVNYATGTPPPVYIFFYTDSRDPPSNLNFIAQYMMFFPFNEGKNACTTMAPNDECLGSRVVMGNHVGDWEIASIRFVNGLPKTIHVGAHGNAEPETASTYVCCEWNDPKAPDKPKLEWMGEHPVLYTAGGSHGIYGWADKHNYFTTKVGDKLNDYTGKGLLWQTWNKIEWPTWTSPSNDVLLNKFTGRWGGHHQGVSACRIFGNVPDSWCEGMGIPTDEYQLNDGPNKPGVGRDRDYLYSR